MMLHVAIRHLCVFVLVLSSVSHVSGNVLRANPKSSSSVVPVVRHDDIKHLKIERNFVSKEVAQALYRDILETAMPSPKDHFHPNLLGFKGDAGGKSHLDDDVNTTNVERGTKFRKLTTTSVAGDDETMHSTSTVTQESGILRVEHLNRNDYDQTNHLINEVVENNVMSDGGTIHLYISKPNSAALNNHTDPTDIFVLQLVGIKEWFLCEENDEDDPTFLLLDGDEKDKNKKKSKLDKCSTYDKYEIDTMNCRREKLYPGDALFLPKRVVHSAREATHEALTAHLTFGFANHEMCSSNDKNREEEALLYRRQPSSSYGLATLSSMHRFLSGSSCDAEEGGTDCDSSCDSDCYSGCDDSCDAFCFGGCTGGCDSSCDDSCHSGCDSDCKCPSALGGGGGGGAVVPVVVVVLLLGLFGSLTYCYYKKKRARQGEVPSNNSNGQGPPKESPPSETKGEEDLEVTSNTATTKENVVDTKKQDETKGNYSGLQNLLSAFGTKQQTDAVADGAPKDSTESDKKNDKTPTTPSATTATKKDEEEIKQENPSEPELLCCGAVDTTC